MKFGNLVIVFVPGKEELYLLPIARMPHRFEVRYLSNVGQPFASSLKIIVVIFKFLLPIGFLDRCAYYQSSHVIRMKILLSSSKLLNVWKRRGISLMDTVLCIWVNSSVFLAWHSVYIYILFHVTLFRFIVDSVQSKPNPLTEFTILKLDIQLCSRIVN
jgi:hypothetical protein